MICVLRCVFFGRKCSVTELQGVVSVNDGCE